VVARNPEKLRAARNLPDSTRLFGPYTGRLSNGGEDVRLRDNGMYNGKEYYPETIDAVQYRDEPPWPRLPDGGGRSLELENLSLDNDYPTSWRASSAEGGTPGR